MANIYGDAGPDLVTVINNVPTISNTIVDEQDNLNATLLAAIGLANEGADTLEPAADDYIAAIQRLRAPLKVLGDYSPVLGCIVQGVATGAAAGRGRSSVAYKPGAMVSSSFVSGRAVVHLSGEPADRERVGRAELPRPSEPSQQAVRRLVLSGRRSWSPTTRYIPYEPFTEVQVDAPSTFQFLFNGAFAERDDF